MLSVLFSSVLNPRVNPLSLQINKGSLNKTNSSEAVELGSQAMVFVQVQLQATGKLATHPDSVQREKKNPAFDFSVRN